MTSISTKAPRHSMPTTMFPHVPGTTSLQRKFLWLGDPSMESHYGKALDFLQEPKEDSLHSSALKFLFTFLLLCRTLPLWEPDTLCQGQTLLSDVLCLKHSCEELSEAIQCPPPYILVADNITYSDPANGSFCQARGWACIHCLQTPASLWKDHKPLTLVILAVLALGISDHSTFTQTSHNKASCGHLNFFFLTQSTSDCGYLSKCCVRRGRIKQGLIAWSKSYKLRFNR